MQIVTEIIAYGSSVLAFIQKLVPFMKGKTTHVDWDSANVKASEFATKIRTSVISQYPKDASKIGLQYLNNLIAHIERIGRWKDNVPEPTTRLLSQLRQRGNQISTEHLGGASWLWAMWVIRNVDATSQNEFADVFRFDIENTLLLAIRQVTGEQVSFSSMTGIPIKESEKEMNESESASFSLTQNTIFGILIVIAIIIFAFIMMKKGK